MTIAELTEAIKNLLDEVEAEGRDLTADELEEVERMQSELDAATERRDRTAALRAKAEQRAAIVRPAVATRTVSQESELDRAFGDYLRTGQVNADIAELRAQSVGTDTAGGYTVPPSFRQRLVDRMAQFGGLANHAETITTDTGAKMTFPTLDDTANRGQIAAEGAGGTGGADLVFGEIEVEAFKYVAPGADGPLRVSVELVQDSAESVERLVVDKLGMRIARAQAADFVNGDGTGAPLGLAAGSSDVVATAGATPDLAELISIVHSVDPAYRQSAAWIFNDATLAAIRSLVDDNGRPLWLPSADSGMTALPGGTLLGFPVVIDQAFGDGVDASEGVYGAFGDLRETYLVRRVKDITVVVDPFTRAHEGQICYSLHARAGGTVQNPHAAVLIANDDA